MVNARPDHSVWRQGVAVRASVFVDVADYLAAAKSAMARARRSIHFLNWSFEPQTRFLPTPGRTASRDDEIGVFLKRLAGENRGLDVRILCWKSALPVAATQGFFPLQDRRSFRGSAVKFALDGRLPFGACHHQKMIVIDDAVAFCGGADIGPDRWDTPRHLDQDPRRAKAPGGRRFFDSRHEVMAVVDGGAAATLGVLFRDRWLRATGESLSQPPQGSPTAWPKGVEPDLSDVTVGVSRTIGAWRTYAEVRESRALTLASIATARRCIYMENQYFTSPVVAEALAARLAAVDGPEVVLISTQHSPSWFDRLTMDRTRGDFIHRLRKADRYGRFRIYSPTTDQGRIVIVHAKLAIIDDRLLRIGSSNMNNRSAGFDTECDLSFKAENATNRAAIARLRTRLVAHWLGCGEDEVREAVEREGGVGGAIEAQRALGYGRLRPITPESLGPAARFIAAFHIGDPLTPDDSLRPLLRRRRLAAEVAAVAEYAALPQAKAAQRTGWTGYAQPRSRRSVTEMPLDRDEPAES